MLRPGVHGLPHLYSDCAELGWIEGRTIAIEYRWSEGLPTRNAEIAAEFVRLKVDVIVTTSFALSTLMQATEVIPLVFPLGTDPIAAAWLELWRDQEQRHWTASTVQ